jgi:NitT/TauT family transport system substrate-binding protein
LTRSVLEAGDLVSRDAADAAAVYARYGGRGSLDDLAAMLRSHTHHHHPVGAALNRQISLYTEELKRVHVIKPGIDPARFADRVVADVLA